ncbi:hypothetical protein KTD31_00300 [Burkholderia multivorans]|uniref:hypothetical protein n=1 Tax=Burkholderia multivorans TaxID=87883 RepID=UPI001C23AD42|nr:hypothetical protein [Burkholderia multivorans]MBU9199839.1 hypothetical protein [Burkholderia multivorans]MDN8079042.1 hypothetical protein [Burkholderia multivorans]
MSALSSSIAFHPHDMATTTPAAHNPSSSNNHLTPEESPAVKLAVALLLAALVLGALFILACDAWLAYRVPVSTQDLRDASWLLSYAPTDYFSAVVGTFFALGVMAVGLVAGLVKKSATCALLGPICAICLHVVGLPSVQFRQSAGAGTAKIGCYVWDTRECKTMLGVPADNAPSMYRPRAEADATGEVYAVWYEKARTGLKPHTLLVAAPLLSVPYYAFHPEELNAKLNAQRNEVARFRASHGATHSARP